MEFKLLKHYQSDFPEVMKIIICSDNSLLLCSSKCRILKRVIPLSNVLKEMATFNLWFIDVAQSAYGDLIFSTEDSSLKVITNGTKTVKEIPNFNVTKGRIVTIHINDERKKILVGVCMNEYNESGQVLVMDETGRHETKYQYSSTGRWLFQYPESIATNKNNIAVVDRGDLHRKDNSGSVVILSYSDDKILNVYKGHLNTYKSGYHPFRPFDVVSTKSNNFIVSDTCVYNPILHVLNSEGQYLTYCNTKEELGINLPSFLSIDKSGILFVGSQTYKRANHTNFYLVNVEEF